MEGLRVSAVPLAMGTMGGGAGVDSPRPTQSMRCSAGAQQQQLGPSTFDNVNSSAAAKNLLLSNSKYSSFQDYVWKEGDRPRVPHNAFSQASDLPTFDLSVFRDDRDAPARKRAMAELGSATREWGFFQLTNHGVDLDFIRRVEAMARAVFALPPERKVAALREPTGTDGYSCGALGALILGDQSAGSSRLDNISWQETFHFPQTPEVIESFSNALFPGGNEQFRSGIHDYFTLLEALGREVIELLTENLGCKPDTLTFKDGRRLPLRQGLRMNLYPPYPNPELTIGLVPHTDPSLVTILHQDSVGGLQIEKDGKWIAVRPEPNCFVINVGDPFQVYSNDIYQSVLHRAVVNSSQERLSLAMFIGPLIDADLAPFPELLREGKTNPYVPFTYADYRKVSIANKTDSRNNLARFRVHSHP